MLVVRARMAGATIDMEWALGGMLADVQGASMTPTRVLEPHCMLDARHSKTDGRV